MLTRAPLPPPPPPLGRECCREFLWVKLCPRPRRICDEPRSFHRSRCAEKFIGSRRVPLSTRFPAAARSRRSGVQKEFHSRNEVKIARPAPRAHAGFHLCINNRPAVILLSFRRRKRAERPQSLCVYVCDIYEIQCARSARWTRRSFPSSIFRPTSLPCTAATHELLRDTGIVS